MSGCPPKYLYISKLVRYICEGGGGLAKALPKHPLPVTSAPTTSIFISLLPTGRRTVCEEERNL